jgi:hypothetical protein
MNSSRLISRSGSGGRPSQHITDYIDESSGGGGGGSSDSVGTRPAASAAASSAYSTMSGLEGLDDTLLIGEKESMTLTEVSIKGQR